MTPRFRDGRDTPRVYLERCFAVIADREPVVKAWVVLNPSGAREAADASTERYRRGLPIWPIDGMPIGVKDLIETKACRPGMAAPARQPRDGPRSTPSRRRASTAFYSALRDAGVEVLRAIDDPLIGAFENGTAAAKAITTDIWEWENRWSFENLVEQYPGKFICSAKWTRPSRLFRNL